MSGLVIAIFLAIISLITFNGVINTNDDGKLADETLLGDTDNTGISNSNENEFTNIEIKEELNINKNGNVLLIKPFFSATGLIGNINTIEVHSYINKETFLYSLISQNAQYRRGGAERAPPGYA
ncbi:MAG: hypothetical protein WCV50_01045 [Patescibacteria group bacterium]|jgi:hypothetical protein